MLHSEHCYTSFAYVDFVNLTTDHIKIGIEGTNWLIKNRQKTGIFREGSNFATGATYHRKICDAP